MFSPIVLQDSLLVEKESVNLEFVSDDIKHEPTTKHHTPDLQSFLRDHMSLKEPIEYSSENYKAK